MTERNRAEEYSKTIGQRHPKRPSSFPSVGKLMGFGLIALVAILFALLEPLREILASLLGSTQLAEFLVSEVPALKAGAAVSQSPKFFTAFACLCFCLCFIQTPIMVCSFRQNDFSGFAKASTVRKVAVLVLVLLSSGILFYLPDPSNPSHSFERILFYSYQSEALTCLTFASLFSMTSIQVAGGLRAAITMLPIATHRPKA